MLSKIFKGIGFTSIGLCAVGALGYHHLAKEPENEDPEKYWIPSETWTHPRTRVINRLYELYGPGPKALSAESSLRSLMKDFRDENGVEIDGSGDQFFEGIRLQMRNLSQLPPNFAAHSIRAKQLEKGILYRNDLLSYVAKHPEVRDIKIEKPLFLIGMPRTGTTLLFNLLSLDPKCRSPLYLELSEMGDPLSKDQVAHITETKAYKETAKNREISSFLFPGWFDLFQKHHPLPIDGPEEDYFLFTYSGIDLVWSENLSNPEFFRWQSDSSSKQSVYRLLKRFLQTRQAVYPAESHWICKAPIHLIYLDRLIEEFPDACLVKTNRPLINIIPSFLELGMVLQSALGWSKVYERLQLAKEVLDMAEVTLTNYDNFCKSRPDLDVFNVSFDELVKDPIAVVKLIYQHFGYSLSDEHLALMEAWVQKHHQGRPQKTQRDAIEVLSKFKITEQLIDQYPKIKESWT